MDDVSDGVEERNPAPQNPRLCSLPSFPFLWVRERNRAITQNYEMI